jgi:hypothetical protein
MQPDDRMVNPRRIAGVTRGCQARNFAAENWTERT